MPLNETQACLPLSHIELSGAATDANGIKFELLLLGQAVVHWFWIAAKRMVDGRTTHTRYSSKKEWHHPDVLWEIDVRVCQLVNHQEETANWTYNENACTCVCFDVVVFRFEPSSYDVDVATNVHPNVKLYSSVPVTDNITSTVWPLCERVLNVDVYLVEHIMKWADKCRLLRTR